MYIIYTSCCVAQQQPPKRKLARKENTYSHNSSCPGSIKSHTISLRRSFWLTYFIWCGHMEQVILGRRNHTFWTQSACPKSVEIIMNGVPMAPHGLIFD